MATTPATQGTPLTREQSEIAERLRHWLKAKADDENETRDLALVRLIDRSHAAELMDPDTQGASEVQRLLADYPEDAITRDKVFQLILNGQPPELLVTLPGILNRARALRADLLLLSEYGWALGKDDVDTDIAGHAENALTAALRGLVTFCHAYGIPVRGDTDLTVVAEQMERAA